MNNYQNSALREVEMGPWKVSLDYGILASPYGKTLILEPRLSKLMYLLSLNENRIVSRDYLAENIWKDTIVNEESLTRAIADLRKTLSSNFNDAIKIDTIPKRGYRLVLGIAPKIYALKLKLNRRSMYALVGVVALVVALLVLLLI